MLWPDTGSNNKMWLPFPTMGATILTYFPIPRCAVSDVSVLKGKIRDLIIVGGLVIVGGLHPAYYPPIHLGTVWSPPSATIELDDQTHIHGEQPPPPTSVSSRPLTTISPNSTTITATAASPKILVIGDRLIIEIDPSQIAQ
jgi:hypothetical protein